MLISWPNILHHDTKRDAMNGILKKIFIRMTETGFNMQYRLHLRELLLQFKQIIQPADVRHSVAAL